jgi:hypothetical protein
MGTLRVTILCLAIFSSVAHADNSNAPLKNKFPRTEFSNEALLQGINYNVWWYRAFSVGTSWNGPEKAISKIEERADKSPQDAQQLLLGLSAILKNEAPAGEHVVSLYGSLLKKSQKQSSMLMSTLSQVFSDRGWSQETTQESQFNQNDSVNRKLLDFIAQDLRLPSLRDSRHLNAHNTLLSIYINFGDRTATKNLESMIIQISKSNNEKLKVDISEKLFDLMTMNSLYFQSTEITSVAAGIIELRRTLLSSINSVKRRELVTHRIEAYQVSNDVYLSYFNFKKIEVDLAILEELGGVEALNAYSQKIRQMVELIERIDRRISEATARISRSVGYVPRSAIGGIMRSYQSGEVTLSNSRDTAEVIRLIDLRTNTERETRELIDSIKQVCYKASQRSDEVVLRSCANSVIENLLIARKEARSDSSLRYYLSEAISYIFNISGKYFNPSNFNTSCFEDNLEKAVNDTTAALKTILNLKVRLPKDFIFTNANGTENKNIGHFMFVDCSLPLYAALINDRNMSYATISSNIEDIRYMTQTFFIDETTVGTCIAPFAQMNDYAKSLLNHRIAKSRLSLSSYQKFTFLSSIYNRWTETIRFRQHENVRIYGEDSGEGFINTLNTDEKRFHEVLSHEVIKSYFPRGYFRTSESAEDVFSGDLLPLHLKKICLSKSTNQPVNCIAGRGQIRCKESSLFRATFDVKK